MHKDIHCTALCNGVSGKGKAAVEVFSRVREYSSIKHKHRAGLCYFANDGGKGEREGSSQGVYFSHACEVIKRMLKVGGEMQNKQPMSLTMNLL